MRPNPPPPPGYRQSGLTAQQQFENISSQVIQSLKSRRLEDPESNQPTGCDLHPLKRWKMCRKCKDAEEKEINGESSFTGPRKVSDSLSENPIVVKDSSYREKVYSDDREDPNMSYMVVGNKKVKTDEESITVTHRDSSWRQENNQQPIRLKQDNPSNSYPRRYSRPPYDPQSHSRRSFPSYENKASYSQENNEGQNGGEGQAFGLQGQPSNSNIEGPDIEYDGNNLPPLVFSGTDPLGGLPPYLLKSIRGNPYYLHDCNTIGEMLKTTSEIEHQRKELMSNARIPIQPLLIRMIQLRPSPDDLFCMLRIDDTDNGPDKDAPPELDPSAHPHEQWLSSMPFVTTPKLLSLMFLRMVIHPAQLFNWLNMMMKMCDSHTSTQWTWYQFFLFLGQNGQSMQVMGLFMPRYPGRMVRDWERKIRREKEQRFGVRYEEPTYSGRGYYPGGRGRGAGGQGDDSSYHHSSAGRFHPNNPQSESQHGYHPRPFGRGHWNSHNSFNSRQSLHSNEDVGREDDRQSGRHPHQYNRGYVPHRSRNEDGPNPRDLEGSKFAKDWQRMDDSIDHQDQYRGRNFVRSNNNLNSHNPRPIDGSRENYRQERQKDNEWGMEGLLGSQGNNKQQNNHNSNLIKRGRPVSYNSNDTPFSFGNKSPVLEFRLRGETPLDEKVSTASANMDRGNNNGNNTSNNNNNIKDSNGANSNNSSHNGNNNFHGSNNNSNPNNNYNSNNHTGRFGNSDRHPPPPPSQPNVPLNRYGYPIPNRYEPKNSQSDTIPLSTPTNGRPPPPPPPPPVGSKTYYGNESIGEGGRGAINRNMPPSGRVTPQVSGYARGYNPTVLGSKNSTDQLSTTTGTSGQPVMTYAQYAQKQMKDCLVAAPALVSPQSPAANYNPSYHKPMRHNVTQPITGSNNSNVGVSNIPVMPPPQPKITKKDKITGQMMTGLKAQLMQQGLVGLDVDEIEEI